MFVKLLDEKAPESIASMVAQDVETRIVAALRKAQLDEMIQCAQDVCAGCRIAAQDKTWLRKAEAVEHFDTWVHLDDAKNSLWMKCLATAIWKRYDRIVNPYVPNVSDYSSVAVTGLVAPLYNMEYCNPCSGTGVNRMTGRECLPCGGKGYLQR